MNHINTFEPSPDSMWCHGLRSVFITDVVCSLRGTSGICMCNLGQVNEERVKKAGLWTEI